MSLYMLQEAGALLTAGATAGAFLGGDASPPFMPRLPYAVDPFNAPAFGEPPTPMIDTEVPPGTPPPPSAYGSAYQSYVEAGALLDDSAGRAAHPGHAAHDSYSEAGDTLIYSGPAPVGPAPPQAPADAPIPAPPPAHRRGFRHVPTNFTLVAPPPPARIAPPMQTPDLATGATPPASTTPWLAIGAAGAVLAFLYFGRKKRRGR